MKIFIKPVLQHLIKYLTVSTDFLNPEILYHLVSTCNRAYGRSWDTK